MISSNTIEMNSTSIYLDPVQTVHFLSVFHYINTLNDILYSKDILESVEQFQPFPVINALFDYLNQTNDETEAKRFLVQKLLQGSGLYGGNKNETLDLDYIDETFRYIINKVVFANYGNIYGYLASIVNLSNNLTLSSFKQEIFDKLGEMEYFNQDGSVSKLSPLAIIRIRDLYLWPLFPQTKQEMNITDINYIYAQAGSIFAESAQINLSNITFIDYITISQTLELAALQNQIDQSVLKIFTLPALIFYAFREKDKFRQQRISDGIRNKTFLSDAFTTLFVHLNETFETINQEAYKSSPLHEFNVAMSEYKNRTYLAEIILRKNCPFLKESEYESAVDSYRFYASGRCTNSDSKQLPNIDDEVLLDNLKDKILLPNSDVELSNVDDNVLSTNKDDNVLSTNKDDNVVLPNVDENFVLPNVDNNVVILNISDNIEPSNSNDNVLKPNKDENNVLPNINDSLVIPDINDKVLTPNRDDNDVLPNSDDSLVLPNINHNVLTSNRDDSDVVPITDDSLVSPNNNNKVLTPNRDDKDVLPNTDDSLVLNINNPNINHNVLTSNRDDSDEVPNTDDSLVIPDINDKVFTPNKDDNDVSPNVDGSSVLPNINHNVPSPNKDAVLPNIPNLPNIQLPKTDNIVLPSIDELLTNQIDNINKKYRTLLRFLIRKVFLDADLAETINSKDTIAFESQVVPIEMDCSPDYCLPYEPHLEPNTYLFALRHKNRNSFYALVNNQSAFSLLSSNSDDFLKKLHIPEYSQLEVSPTAIILKHQFQDFETFVDNIVISRANKLTNILYTFGYQNHFEERIVDALLALIPFPDCGSFAKTGNNFDLSCFIDTLEWIPFVEQFLGIGTKRLLEKTGVSLRTFAMRQAIRFDLQNQNKLDFRNEMFNSLSLDIIRDVDPRIVGKLSPKGSLGLDNLLKQSWTRVSKTFPRSHIELQSSLLELGTKGPKFGSSQHSKGSTTEGLIPVLLGQLNNYDVFSYIYPGGENLFGPRYVRLPNVNAELRRATGFDTEIPVIVSRVTKFGKTFYKKVDTNGEVLGPEFKLNEKGWLQPNFLEHQTDTINNSRSRECINGNEECIQEELDRRNKVIGSGNCFVEELLNRKTLEYEKCIKESSELVSNSNLGINASSAENVIRHYVLATHRNGNVQKNSKPTKLSPNVKKSPTSVKSYIPLAPTYTEFARVWIKSGNIDKKYNKYYTPNPKELEILRYGRIEDNQDESKIDEICDQNDEELGTSLFDVYNSSNAALYVSFEDYSALLLWVQNGYTDLTENVNVQKRIRNAIYKLAIRQADTECAEFPKVLYHTFLRSNEVVEKEILHSQGRSTMSNMFIVGTTKEDVVHNDIALLRDTNSNCFQNCSEISLDLVPVVYETHLNSRYSLVNLNHVISISEKHAVILPDIRFLIKKVKRKNIFGREVIYVILHQTRVITKEQLLVQMMKKIDHNFKNSH